MSNPLTESALAIAVGPGTAILPGTILRGNTSIGKNCTIGPNAYLENAKIGDNTVVNASQIYNSTVGFDTHVGPFAYIRPGSSVGNHVKVGDFVEIKNSVVDDGTKISHLTYVGDSGVGKSETAIELVKRGHRLIADDAIEIRKISNKSLIGQSPENIQHFVELRGVGIINIARTYGAGAVKQSQEIDMVIELEHWKPEKSYSTIGLNDEYMDIMGVSVIKSVIPVRPGRNLSIIIETAAIVNRQKKMGYNAAQELYRRVQENLTKKSDDEEDE